MSIQIYNIESSVFLLNQIYFCLPPLFATAKTGIILNLSCATAVDRFIDD